MPETHSCPGCRYAHRHKTNYNEDVLLCRRYPPVADPEGSYKYPLVLAGDWCGEFWPTNSPWPAPLLAAQTTAEQAARDAHAADQITAIVGPPVVAYQSRRDQ